MALIKSTANNIYPPSVGNSLAVFVDISDGILKFKDQNGNTNTLSAYAESGVIIEGTGLGSTLRCGLDNTSIAPCSVITGGQSNKVGASGCYGTVSGGFTNSAYGIGGFVGGGSLNIAGIGQGGSSCCDCCLLGEGVGTPVVDVLGIGLLIESCYSFVGGGCCNQSFGLASVVSGGAKNMASSSYSSVGGGVCNSSCSAYSYIGGGQCNTIRCMYGSILGGACNNVNHQFSSVVGCGITTTAGCTFFANNICATTDMYVGGLTSGCAVCVGANGKLTNSAGGGGSVMIAGSGLCSTVRCGVDNTAVDPYTSSLGGRCNYAGGCCSVTVSGYCNSTFQRLNFIGGGFFNKTNSAYSSIINGCCNCNRGGLSIIGSGVCNTICDGASNSVIVVGQNNLISGDRSFIGAAHSSSTFGTRGFIGNGTNNVTCSFDATILSGDTNIASGTKSIVMAGRSNTVSAYYSSIINGSFNTLSGRYSIILNGKNNILSGCFATLSGYYNRNTSTCFSFIAGCFNCISGHLHNTIHSGRLNCLIGGVPPFGGGCYKTILNGESNAICDNSYSFIGNGISLTINSGSGYNNTIVNGANSRICNFLSCIPSFNVILTGNGNCTVGRYASIVNGFCNVVGSVHSSVLSGCRNTISACYSVALGGTGNTISGYRSALLTGSSNILSGQESVVLFGSGSTIAGQGSLIAGGLNTISASYNNSYILGRSIIADRSCTLFANNLSLKSLPTASTGLPSGAVWRCTADNTLRIIP